MVARIIDGSPLTGIAGNGWMWGMEQFNFADLVTEFGPDAFKAFWTSELEVPDAFRSAFGLGMDEWMLSWVTANFGMSKAGPGLTRSAGFGGLLAMSALAIIGGAWARRRRVA